MPLDRKTLRARRLIFLSLVALLALAAGLYFLIRWNTHDRFYVTTDNAFVVGNIIPVQADATGVVAEVLVEETNKVKAGELLVRLDEQRAKAMLDQSAADLARVVRSVGGQFAARRQACQKIASQIALRDKTHHDVMRYRQALPSGAVSQQVLQNAMDQLASLDAELHESRADFQSFEARLGGLTLRATICSNDRAQSLYEERRLAHSIQIGYGCRNFSRVVRVGYERGGQKKKVAQLRDAVFLAREARIEVAVNVRDECW